MMNEVSSPSQQKRENFANQIRSEQRHRIFNEQRHRLQEAQKKGDQKQMEDAMKELKDLFKNHTTQFEEMMALASKHDEEQQKYYQYMEEMEEESMNFEMQQRKENIEAIKKEMLTVFEDPEWSNFGQNSASNPPGGQHSHQNSNAGNKQTGSSSDFQDQNHLQRADTYAKMKE